MFSPRGSLKKQKVKSKPGQQQQPAPVPQFKFTFDNIVAPYRDPAPIYLTPENLGLPIGAAIRISMRMDNSVKLWYGSCVKVRKFVLKF